MDSYPTVAAALGLDWVEGEGPEIQQALQGLPFFIRAPANRLANRMTGLVDGTEVLIFEHRPARSGPAHTPPAGGERHRPGRQTVIGFRSDALDLPPFEMVPEGLVQKIGALFGGQDIDFGDSPRFSRRYTLRGAGEETIRRMFSPEVRAYFAERRGWSLEGSGDVLALYRAGEVAPPSRVPEWLEVARSFLGMIG